VSAVERILVLNNYDLEQAREAVATGASPDHILFGLNHFERRGYSVEIVPVRCSRGLQRASAALRRFPIPLGDLDQQASVMRAARAADLVYCPCQNIAQMLGYMRWAHLFDRPIVWVVHHPLDTGRLRHLRRPAMRALLRGLDAYPALSEPVARDFALIAGSDERTGVVQWGPDATWYPTRNGVGSGVVSAGRTNRDVETFAKGAGLTDVQSRIVTSGMTHRELLDLYTRARAVAIPLKVQWPWPMNGLQSLMDALGVGKPVIMTRNPWLDIDVEQLGIGIWVAPGDVNGWRDAIQYLDERPDAALAMGSRARALVDQGGRSSAAFAEQVMAVFERVSAGGRHGSHSRGLR
jgi:glycosyltransferase involved in cell wall biosynthesis